MNKINAGDIIETFQGHVYVIYSILDSELFTGLLKDAKYDDGVFTTVHIRTIAKVWDWRGNFRFSL